MIRKKYLLSLLLAAYMSNADTIYATSLPPAYQVLSAEIHIVQGAKIYGNGLMQSVLRISYELAKGVTFSKIELKEFGSEKSLVDIGWTESDKDNGFDHNIGEIRLENRSQDIIDENNYKNIYVSTKIQNSWLRVCFELTTKKKLVTAIYSTCKDEGMINGSVNLFSARPKNYFARDFIFKEAAYLLNIPYDVDGMLHTLTPGFNIARDIHFSVVDFKYPKNRFLDNTVGSLLLRSYFNPESTGRYDVSYMDTWLLSPTENTKFQVISDIKKVVEKLIPSTFYPKAIMHIWNVRYRKNTYLAQNWRCRKHPTIHGKELCSVPDGRGGIKEEEKDYKTQIKQYIEDKRSVKLSIQDNYGTMHPLTIFYGFGEHAKTLFIE